MNTKASYGKEYFEGIYAYLKKEKSPVLRSFFDLLISEQAGIKKILDVGCGEGEFLEICQKAGTECFGVDISNYALKKAKGKVKGKLASVNVETEKLPYPDEYFDTITSFDLLEHLRNPGFLFRELKRVLKKDGLLFLTTPNGDYWPAGFLGHFVRDDPTHINIQGKKYWCKYLKKAGFSSIKIKGSLLFGFPPSLELRHLFKRIRIPVLTRPIFFPILPLTSELFIFARKQGAK